MRQLVVALTLLLTPALAWATPPSRSCTYTAGETISPTCVGGNEDDIFEYLQGGVDTIADNAVVSADILNGTIANADLGSSSVTSASITDATIVNGDVADDTLAVGKMADGDWGDFTLTTNVAAIDPNAVVLSTDTSGNFVATVADNGTTTIDVANSGAENAAVTVGITADSVGATSLADADFGDFSCADGGGGCLVDANAVALGTDTTNNYVATIADAGNTTVTVANSGSESAAVTLDAVDVNCSNCIDGTDIALGSDAQGDVYYYNGTDVVRLGAGTDGQVLETNGAAANPSWTDRVSTSGTTTIADSAPSNCTTFDNTTANITVTATGRPVLLTLGLTIHSTDGADDYAVRVDRNDGTALTAYSGINVGTDADSNIQSFSWTDVPTAGATTYNVQVCGGRVDGGAGPAGTLTVDVIDFDVTAL